MITLDTLHTNFQSGLDAIRNNTHSGFFLDSDRSPIERKEIAELLAALKENCTLKELFLRGITLSNQQFVDLLNATKCLKRLDLVNGFFTDFNAEEIGKALNTSSVTTLNLTLTGIVEEQALSVLKQLNETRKQQTSIHLWSKKVTLCAS
jgi:hypothetical protein